MRFFAIQHKPFGVLMPLVHKGSTHLDLPWGADRPPRLFKDARQAQVSLTWWLKGRTEIRYFTDWESGREENADLCTVHVEGRNADDMAVVSVDLVY